MNHAASQHDLLMTYWLVDDRPALQHKLLSRFNDQGQVNCRTSWLMKDFAFWLANSSVE